MPRQIEVMMPYGEPTGSSQARPALVPRPGSLAGLTVGVVWNGWHCMEVIKDRLRDVLARDYGAKEVVGLQTGTTLPMSADQLAVARDTWDVAIVGLGT
jgi:hypothetical protein